jgi:hypothetical protein
MNTSKQNLRVAIDSFIDQKKLRKYKGIGIYTRATSFYSNLTAISF